MSEKTPKNKVIWIYESPDKGKTIYRRPFGDIKNRELIRLNGIDIKTSNN